MANAPSLPQYNNISQQLPSNELYKLEGLIYDTKDTKREIVGGILYNPRTRGRSANTIKHIECLARANLIEKVYYKGGKIRGVSKVPRYSINTYQKYLTPSTPNTSTIHTSPIRQD